MNNTFQVVRHLRFPRSRHSENPTISITGSRRVLGAARTRVHASHGGAHGPENRREIVLSARGAREKGMVVQREERRGKRRQQQQQQQQRRRRWQRRRWRQRRRRSRRKRAKGGSFVGGYRENEARHRVPHGPFSRHGARQRPQQSGPPSVGAHRSGPCSRQRQRQARASHATRTRPSRPSREHKPRFFHSRRYLPSFLILILLLFLLLLLLLLHHCLLFLLPLPPRSCHQPPSRISVLFSASSGYYRDGPRSRWLRAFFPCFSLWYVRGFLARCRLLDDHVYVGIDICSIILENMTEWDVLRFLRIGRFIID